MSIVENYRVEIGLEVWTLHRHIGRRDVCWGRYLNTQLTVSPPSLSPLPRDTRDEAKGGKAGRRKLSGQTTAVTDESTVAVKFFSSSRSRGRQMTQCYDGSRISHRTPR